MHERTWVFLIKRTETQDEEFFETLYRNRENHRDIFVDYITVDMKIFDYIHDSLTWIPCRIPSLPGMPKEIGINEIGVTLFEEHSASSLISIFTAWRDLFKNGPNIIEERIFFDEGEDTLSFERDDTIERFEKVISMSKQLSEGKYYIYHCGIWKSQKCPQIPLWEGYTSTNGAD